MRSQLQVHNVDVLVSFILSLWLIFHHSESKRQINDNPDLFNFRTASILSLGMAFPCYYSIVQTLT